MAYQLRQYQTDLISKIAASWYAQGNRRVMAQMPTGAGKCLGKNTPVLMFDGSVKLVQDVVIGDLLMGDDSTPRTVLTLARGQEMMYRITPVKGDSWECNESHILSLVWNGDESIKRKKGDIIDVSVYNYLKLNTTQKWCLKQYRVGVEYLSQPTTIDPYYLGVWLGDGTKRNPSITSCDREVTDYCNHYAATLGLRTRIEQDKRTKAVTHHHVCEYQNLVKGERSNCNPLTYLLKKLNLIENKHIPSNYLANDRQTRLQLLAGLLDTDGYLQHGHFEIVQKLKPLADDILTLARGLGFAAYRADKVVNGVTYHRISISGDVSEIPCKVARRIADKRLQQKSVLRTGFSVESIGIGDYYGFEIDGNRRFLLGDYTVTHNTIVLSSIVDEFVKQNLRCLVLAHRTELINQAVEKLENVVNEPCGVIKSGIRANYDRLVQVGSVQSMKSRLGTLPQFDLIVVDESHHVTLKGTYGAVLDYFPNAKVLGVTATPIRLDGKGFRGVFDDLICGISPQDLIEMGSLCQYKYYACEKPMSVLGLKKRGGDFKQEDIEQQNPVEVVANQVYESYHRHLRDKQAVVFATSVAHSIAITEHLRSIGIAAHHLDGMSPTDERQSAMELFRNREIQILSNCSLFDEGLDIPSIDGVILARPTASLSRYLQMVGRSLRPCEGKERAVIIDLADNYERHGMPDDDRDWTLDGIPKKPKERKTSKRERNVITDEIETVSLFDTGTEYVEIAGKTVVLTEELREWMRLADAIIAEGIERSFKPGWACNRLLESQSRPPIEAWRYLGKKLGYHHKWCEYKYQEWGTK